jgi:hypothetical protein
MADSAVKEFDERFNSKKAANGEIRHGGPETPELKPQCNPPLPASNG